LKLRLLGLLRVICTPSCWIQIHPFSAEWDRQLNQLMREHRFKNVGSHTATIGAFTVWIENHPNASFAPHNMNVLSVRPLRATILKAYDKLAYDFFAAPREVEELEQLYALTEEKP
jgi:hypothetical protein